MRCWNRSQPALIAVSLVAITTAWAAARDRRFVKLQGALARQGAWLIWLSLLLVAIALSIPGSPAVGVAVLWISLICTGIGIWNVHRTRHSRFLIALEGPSGKTETASDDSATQKLIYHRTAKGGISVDGWLRIDLIPGQRTAIGHVAFCPAFVQSPFVEAELLDGPSGDIRTTLLLPWGVRWEVKLDEVVIEPQSVTLGFAAMEGGR